MDTVVEHKNFGTRMKNSVSGIFGGIIIFLIGIGVLIFNEFSNSVNARDVKELRKNYTDISSKEVNKEYNDKLIATSGKLDFNNEILKDEQFNISVEAPLLERKVEIYQWEEDKEESEDSTTYNYKKVWSTSIIDSSDFHSSNGHQNPTEKIFDGNRYNAAELKVGAYKLSSVFNSYLDANSSIEDFSSATIPEGFKVSGKYLTNSENPDSPQIGDYRISFNYTNYTNVTVLGKQKDDTIVEYTTKAKTNISHLTEGEHDGEYVINEIEKANKMFKWILRLVGTIMIIGGLNGLFGPLNTLTGKIPILGRVVSGATGLIATLVGLAISLIVIAISWLIFRPLIGICLLAAAILLIILAKKMTSKNKQQPEVQQQ